MLSESVSLSSDCECLNMGNLQIHSFGYFWRRRRRTGYRRRHNERDERRADGQVCAMDRWEEGRTLLHFWGKFSNLGNTRTWNLNLLTVRLCLTSKLLQIERETWLDEDLRNDLIAIAAEKNIPVETGSTLCADDFYEG